MKTHRYSKFGLCLIGGALGAVALCSSSGPTPPSTGGPFAGLLLEAQRRSITTVEALAASDPCTTTAKLAAWAKARELEEEIGISIGKCINLDDPRDVQECIAEAFEAYDEGIELLKEQHKARVDLCGLLGGGIYDPDIDQDDFVDRVDHPLFPLAPGNEWEYEKQTDEGLEELEVEVLDETEEIDGVECTIVHAVETLDGVIVEDTYDYFAQDEDGNVWYFGERVQNFEDGVLVSLDGSWLGEVDGAKQGILMLAQPRVGETYRQEFLLSEAEDHATVLGLDVTVESGDVRYQHCLKTVDGTPIEPGNVEHKFYAPGIGLVKEANPNGGPSLELVEFRKR